MGTILSTAIICIAIMCWLFGTFYFFGCLEEYYEGPSDKLSKFILAIVIGWFVTPILLGIKYSEPL